MTRNQVSVIGPNARPTFAVPNRCTMNSSSRMPIVIGTTKCERAGVAISMPSTAPSTEMAGVMMPSPNSRAVPNTPRMTNSLRRPRSLLRCCRCSTSASSASTPPSPWLSARRMKTRYFTTTTSMIDQNTSDRMPYTFTTDGASPCAGAERLLHRVERARADVAVHHAERGEGEDGEPSAVGMGECRVMRVGGIRPRVRRAAVPALGGGGRHGDDRVARRIEDWVGHAAAVWAPGRGGVRR